MTMPLAFAQEGKDVKVQEINSGLRLKKRLSELGSEGWDAIHILTMRENSVFILLKRSVLEDGN